MEVTQWKLSTTKLQTCILCAEAHTCACTQSPLEGTWLLKEHLNFTAQAHLTLDVYMVVLVWSYVNPIHRRLLWFYCLSMWNFLLISESFPVPFPSLSWAPNFHNLGSHVLKPCLLVAFFRCFLFLCLCTWLIDAPLKSYTSSLPLTLPLRFTFPKPQLLFSFVYFSAQIYAAVYIKNSGFEKYTNTGLSVEYLWYIWDAIYDIYKIYNIYDLNTYEIIIFFSVHVLYIPIFLNLKVSIWLW